MCSESESFGVGEEAFVETTLDFMDAGLEGDNGVFFQGLRPHKDDFGAGVQAFVLTPQREADPAVAEDPDDPDGDTDDPSVHYLDGLNYEEEIGRITARLSNIFPGISPTVVSYRAINKNDPSTSPLLDTTARGKALYQYDPESFKQGERRPGVSLYFEGNSFRTTIGGVTVNVQKGRVYRDVWKDAPDAGENIRLFADPQPLQLSICAGQSYDFTQVRNAAHCTIFTSMLRN